MSAAIIVSVVISWLRAARVRLPYYHPMLRGIEELGELMLRPIRRALPTTAGGLDFSPVVAVLALSLLRSLIIRLTSGVP